MRKVTVKIMIASIVIMIISSFFPRILWDIYNVNSHGLEMDARLFLIGGIASVFIAVTLFVLFMDRFILKRIRSLNTATNEIMKGNYDFSLEMKQKDEVSELMNNFNKMVKELQSNEYLNKEFIRNVSHELKTPLSAINGYAELMKSSNTTPEEITEYATIIAQESHRLSILAKDILQISLVESLAIVQKGEPYKISEQIRNVIQLMQLNWEQKEIEFDLELDKIFITSNKEITYQIWTNLISNAIKFSPGKSTIKISLTEQENNIVFTISNPGTISVEDQEKVFKLFYITSTSDGRDSNGVGLTLTSRIIEKLNGTITLSSEAGQVTFEVVLPIN